MKLNHESLKNAAQWQQLGVKVPAFDRDAMLAATEESPVWVHFGAGNIFRGFIAVLQQRLLEMGLEKSGIIAAETFDFDIIDKIYAPYDSLTMNVTLRADGSTDKEIVASLAKGLKAGTAFAEDWNALQAAFEKPSLQMASFTITEKGYALRDMKGNLLQIVKDDMAAGPDAPHHAMACVASLMYARYLAGAAPIALVSMDNCSHNGEKLRRAVLDVAQAWQDAKLVPAGFVEYLSDEEKVSFPWSMIDKITPRPADVIAQQLEALGIEEMGAVVTSRNTYIAPFVNAEAPQYLVVEDRFPNGRPALEKAGVYMTDRDTVNATERMKVTTCLNPLHTALAVFGCLLGYDTIAAEMKDPDLKKLVETIGYVEGMPVVTDPGILNPEDFLREVLTERLPNPFIPDTPQRIATDTSQKIPIRFGETIKSYMMSPTLNAADLKAIPLALAGWLRYLLAVDDEGKPMPVSPDPMMDSLKAALAAVEPGVPTSAKTALEPILSNPVIFGVNLVNAGLAGKVEALLTDMLAGPGAVRKALKAL
ncbi:MAG: mannitol dehydrogenase family protein [Clostridia bacterium]|nr:mannitol dehydrogenase family protein [Clostridia bacterium]